jgi:hypothetical protein
MDALVAVIVVSNAFLARDCLSKYIATCGVSDLTTAMTVAEKFLNEKQKVYECTLQANAVKPTAPSDSSGAPS